ncbi:MAG: hypothetical protein E7547_06125 [Ruminococcaceae bacterium]|nr:hypothetical protein [Oscillospiraceae bacterium]
MKKTIALMLAMLFALCAFATTAFAENENTTTTTTADNTVTNTVESDDVTDGFDDNTTTTVASSTTTVASSTTTVASSTTTTKAGDTTTTTVAGNTTTTTELVGTLAPGQTSYEGQDQEGKVTTTKKTPAKVESAIPSTGSGIVVPAIALAVLAAGTVAVIKTKKED